MQYIRDLKLVYIASARLVELPPGAKSLIDSDKGSLAFQAPREGFTDVVVTFPLLEGTTPNTTWFRYISFPMFILNTIQALGNVREGAGDEVSEPGSPVVIHAETINREITVTSADRPEEKVPRSPQGTFIYNHAEKAGLYLARWDKDGRLPFAVNLFNFRESDLAPRGLVPEGVLNERGGVVQDQDRLQPRHRHPEARQGPEGHLVVLRAPGPRRAAGRVVCL